MNENAYDKIYRLIQDIKEKRLNYIQTTVGPTPKDVESAISRILKNKTLMEGIRIYRHDWYVIEICDESLDLQSTDDSVNPPDTLEEQNKPDQPLSPPLPEH